MACAPPWACLNRPSPWWTARCPTPCPSDAIPGTATLVVTTALDRSLTLVELEGVLAHELVHIKRHDTVLAAVAVPCSLRGRWWSACPRPPNGSTRWIGRGREFDADQRAAGVVRYPPGIGSALESMLEGQDRSAPWPPGHGRTAALTRWLWVDPMVGYPGRAVEEGNLDDTRVRAAAQSLF